MTDFDEDSQIVRSADTKRQFAERFSVSPRTVSTWLSRGLPFLKLSERAIRVPVAEGTEWGKIKFPNLSAATRQDRRGTRGGQ